MHSCQRADNINKIGSKRTQEDVMLDLKFVRENPEENDTAVKNGENKKERK